MAVIWRTVRDLPKEEGGTPWWHQVNVYCFTSGFDRAQAAWNNWKTSASGERGGRRVGYPRFKKKGSCPDSFTLYHDVKQPSIRLDGYRHVTLPKIGRVRVHGSTRRLARLIAGGQARIQSVTVTRRAQRWYASVSCKLFISLPAKPNARQRAGGTVGVDLGSRYLAVLSHGVPQPSCCSESVIPHPRHLLRSLPAMAKTARLMARAKPGSTRYRKRAVQLARLHHLVALRRAGTLHKVTKSVARSHEYVAIEDFDLVDLLASTRRKPAPRGIQAGIKSLFNRQLMDAALGELRRQLEYKCPQYGSNLIKLERGQRVASMCSRCGKLNKDSLPSHTNFACPSCNYVTDRHENAAACILMIAQRRINPVASGSGET
ncbi:RNA-guided endonuclease TnpB family protein [Streptomyces sp. ISL-66]|uniref:RNA-guided endonuclease TnpB family protein n=1 Tax=Streptomyces sp. ISL-66 TaxID=2819186 RepID=UPI0035B4B908